MADNKSSKPVTLSVVAINGRRKHAELYSLRLLLVTAGKQLAASVVLIRRKCLLQIV